jgi:hypothetical protein
MLIDLTMHLQLLQPSRSHTLTVKTSRHYFDFVVRKADTIHACSRFLLVQMRDMQSTYFSDRKQDGRTAN